MISIDELSEYAKSGSSTAVKGIASKYHVNSTCSTCREALCFIKLNRRTDAQWPCLSTHRVDWVLLSRASRLKSHAPRDALSLNADFRPSIPNPLLQALQPCASNHVLTTLLEILLHHFGASPLAPPPPQTHQQPLISRKPLP